MVVDGPARDDLEAVRAAPRFPSAVGLDHADHDIDAFALARLGGGEHLVGLADARRGAEENLQPAARLLLRVRKQRVGRGPPSRRTSVVHTVHSCPSSLEVADRYPQLNRHSRVQRQVELQHVDLRLADDAQQRGR